MPGNQRVGVVMGSKSDWPTMCKAAEVLDELGISYETEVVSAHRTPEKMLDYARSAKSRGLALIIAGAEDRLVDMSDTARAADALPNAELAVLPECGHVPQEECPDLVKAIIADWLRHH